MEKILEEITKALEAYRVAHDGNVSYGKIIDRNVVYPLSKNPGIVIVIRDAPYGRAYEMELKVNYVSEEYS